MKSEKRRFGFNQLQKKLNEQSYEGEDYTTKEKRQVAMDLYVHYKNAEKAEAQRTKNAIQ